MPKKGTTRGHYVHVTDWLKMHLPCHTTFVTSFYGLIHLYTIKMAAL